ncbi:helix-turn-helix domain-containing protein [Gemmata massiliana]|uniref:helix-turn-helix domain-containing protein n=1 Tax=Gemmata massiliana TaxID=1210884 RepID=UPI0013A6C588|nr:helix-turn-helix domain-containing protein [Gemmata massiliana]
MTPVPPATLDGLDALPGEQFRQVLELLAALAESASPKSETSKYLTVRDAAAYCRVAVQTIYNNRRYIARMPGVRKLLFTREALDTWLATRRKSRRKQK